MCPDLLPWFPRDEAPWMGKAIDNIETELRLNSGATTGRAYAFLSSEHLQQDADRIRADRRRPAGNAVRLLEGRKTERSTN